MITQQDQPEVWVARNSVTIATKLGDTVRFFTPPESDSWPVEQEYTGIDDLSLSNESGRALLQRRSNEFLLIERSGEVYNFSLPSRPGKIMDYQLLEPGDRLALLHLEHTYGANASEKANGTLEIWQFKPEVKLTAQTTLFLFDYGQLSTNGTGSKVFVFSKRLTGKHVFSGLFSLCNETFSNSPHTAFLQNKDWHECYLTNNGSEIITDSSGLYFSEKISKPIISGPVRSLVFSPNENVALVCQILSFENENFSGARARFSIVDMARQTTLSSFERSIKNYQNCYFIILNDQKAYSVRIEPELQLFYTPIN